MAKLTKGQKEFYDKRIALMKEEGFFLPEKRDLASDTLYLFIGYGGTGGAALKGLKKKIAETVNKDEIKSRIRYLAIDTDGTDKNKEGFELDEFFQLSGVAARELLGTDKNIASWINPRVENLNKNEKTRLDNNGASGVRQNGRLALYHTASVDGITGKIENVLRGLATGVVEPKLQVYIVTGIAGGTGSGTVIDLTYLIRHVIYEMGDFGDRVKYSGVVMLPPTGTSEKKEDITQGNRNGYAAMKEINYFMRLESHGSAYEFNYQNGTTVKSKSNLFDICYLLDGKTERVRHAKPRENAIRVLTEFIVDVITTSQVDGATDGTVQTLEAYMSDVSTKTFNVVANNPSALCVRDADYIYNVLGHSEFAIPKNEIKAYLARGMFQKLSKTFANCDNVTDKHVREVMTTIQRGDVSSDSAIQATMSREIKPIFMDYKSYGPSYVVNLLDRMQDICDAEIAELERKVFVFNKADKIKVLTMIKQEASKRGMETFNVFNALLDAMKEMFEEQYKTIVVTEKTVDGNKTTYSFVPYSLGSLEGANKLVGYLQHLYRDEGNQQKIMNALLTDMWDNRKSWVSLVNEGQGYAMKHMRAFWNDNLDALYSASLQDLLVKVFSKEAGASTKSANSTTHLQSAAIHIFDEMCGTGKYAEPLANFITGGINKTQFNPHIYLMVPKTAKELIAELNKVVAARKGNRDIKVCESTAEDRISCYLHYTSVPAYKLAWAGEAEIDYEKNTGGVVSDGVHMSETIGGKQWRNFPNLLPVSSWTLLPKRGGEFYSCDREKKITDHAVEIFDKAEALYLTHAGRRTDISEETVYKVDLLPEAYLPDELLLKELGMAQESREKNAKQAEIDAAVLAAAEKLFALRGAEWRSSDDIVAELKGKSVAMTQQELYLSHDEISYAPGEEPPADWWKTVAGRNLRRMIETMNALDRTNMVIEKLKELIKAQEDAAASMKFFIDYLVGNMFVRDAYVKNDNGEGFCDWNYTDSSDRDVLLVSIDTDMLKAMELYQMYQAYVKKRAAIDAELKDRYDEIKSARVAPEGSTRDERIAAAQKKAEYKKSLEKLLEQFTAWNRANPLKNYAKVLPNKGYDLQVIYAWYDSYRDEIKDLIASN